MAPLGLAGGAVRLRIGSGDGGRRLVGSQGTGRRLSAASASYDAGNLSGRRGFFIGDLARPVAMQNRASNSALYRAVGVDSGMMPSEVIVHEVLARLAHGPLRLGELLRDPQDRDRLLVASRRDSRRALEATLSHEATAAYVLEGRFVPSGWLWRTLSRRYGKQPV
jgi:hypothetical protein